MNNMLEFTSRTVITDKIDHICESAFNFKIKDEGLRKEIEDAIFNIFDVLAHEVAEEGELKDCWQMAIAFLMDTVMANVIINKLQDKYIMELENERE